MKTIKKEEVVKTKRGNLKFIISSMLAALTAMSLTVLASAADGDSAGVSTMAESFASINLVETIIEPILAIIPIAIPVTVTLLGIKLAVKMFKGLLKG
jgi:uncharacterized membrane protein YvlD (DUF360 family)